MFDSNVRSILQNKFIGSGALVILYLSITNFSTNNPSVNRHRQKRNCGCVIVDVEGSQKGKKGLSG